MKRRLGAALATLAILVFFPAACAADDIVSGLKSLGYGLVPAAQKLQLTGREVVVDSTWGVEPRVDPGHIAVRRLKEGAVELHGLRLEGTGPGRIVLRVTPGTVKTGLPSTPDEAYALKIAPGLIQITGNGNPGLLHGVQSLLQLLRLKGAAWHLPEAGIEDWPALPLRFLHWDTKHHQDRPETLRRFIDWASFFKVNAIGFEIEDKYEFPRHPVVGAPGAFTKAEMQDLTRYALDRHIQLVPQIQSPAHMAYVLKHDEFKHLRADGRSNYQACMCDEEAISLIQDLYQDMIDATPGVEYFHVSTDEVYFAGICDKCRAKRPYNDQNRSLTWVDYVNRMHKWLADRGRKMLCWVEYPLLDEHVKLLPRGLINGVAALGRSEAWNQGLRDAGIPSLVYSSQQGSELLFPNYLSYTSPDNRRTIRGRLEEPGNLVPQLIRRAPNEIIGTYAAAWDDSGLHNETFWLGWVMVSQYGWSPDRPRFEQVIADFMDAFYGPGHRDLLEVYRTLIEGARFYESSFDRVPATRLKPTYGSWAGPGRDTTRIDFRIEPPPLPFAYDETLVADRTFSRRYAHVLARIPEVRRRLDQAIGSLHGSLGSVSRNRYNLEILLSIAQFERHHVTMLEALMDVEDLLLRAAEAQDQERHRDVVSLLSQAQGRVRACLADRADMWAALQSTWEKSRYPKGRSVDGRDFVHVLDDLKDHRADRRAGLDYMLGPLENVGLEKWSDGLQQFIQTYARSRGLETREGRP